MNPGNVPSVPYSQPPTQFFQNREVFPHQTPVQVGFYQPQQQSQQFMNQQCYQPPVGPPNYCNNPIYNQPIPYNNTPQCFPFNNQSVIYNTPPPTPGDYCQSYPMQPPPPPINYCSSFESNTNNIAGNFERTIEQASGPNRKLVKTVFAGKQQKKRFTNKNFDSSSIHNKKKRVVESSNLHEIKPVENIEIAKATEETTVKRVRDFSKIFSL